MHYRAAVHLDFRATSGTAGGGLPLPPPGDVQPATVTALRIDRAP